VGGVDDVVLSYPQFGKGFYFAEDGDVILTRPFLELGVNGTVGGPLFDDLICLANQRSLGKSLSRAPGD
jgi:hypothetical protein